jgi:hypothetical protein
MSGDLLPKSWTVCRLGNSNLRFLADGGIMRKLKFSESQIAFVLRQADEAHRSPRSVGSGH